MATAVRQPEAREPSRGRRDYRFPPGFQRNLIWFALRKFRPVNPIVLFQHLADTYGDIAHYKIGHHNIVFLNHPEYIREVLVVQNDNFIKERTVQRTKMLLGEGMITAEGAEHRAQRQTAQPAFHRQRIVEYGSVMVEEACRTRDSWRAGEQRDIAADMMHLTLNVVARTLFATDLRQEVSELAAAINRIMSLYNFLIMLPAAEWLVHLRPPGLAAFVRARKRIDAVVCRMIDAHRKTGLDRGSLLDLMLAASPANDEASRQSLRDQVITIFLAGYETVANALSWTWYLLSQNPDCELRLHQEVERVLRGGLPAVEDVPRLCYTEKRDGGIAPAVSAGLGDGTVCPQRLRSGRFLSARTNHGADQPVHHAPRSPLFSRPTSFRPRSILGGGQIPEGEIHLLSVWRRRPAVYWRIICLDGRNADSGYAGSEMEAKIGSGASG